MDIEPQKIFIGVMDFFSILLPGALLTNLLKGNVELLVLGDRYYKLAIAKNLAAILFASNLFGLQVFLLVPGWRSTRRFLNMKEQSLFYDRCASFTNTQLPLMKVGVGFLY